MMQWHITSRETNKLTSGQIVELTLLALRLLLRLF